MILDICVILYVVVCVLVGFRRGAALQLFTLVGLMVAALLYFPLGRAIGAAYGRLMNTDSLPNLFLTSGVGAVLVLLLFVAAGHLIRHFVIRPSEKLTKTDRSGGIAMGVLLGLGTVYLAACIFDQLPDQAYAKNERLLAITRDCATLKLVHRINILPDFRVTAEKLHLLSTAMLRHRRASAEILERPAVRALAADGKFKRVLEEARDPRSELHRAMNAGDVWAIINDERVQQLLSDPAVWRKARKALDAVELEELRRITGSPAE